MSDDIRLVGNLYAWEPKDHDIRRDFTDLTRFDVVMMTRGDEIASLLASAPSWIKWDEHGDSNSILRRNDTSGFWVHRNGMVSPTEMIPCKTLESAIMALRLL